MNRRCPVLFTFCCLACQTFLLAAPIDEDESSLDELYGQEIEDTEGSPEAPQELPEGLKEIQQAHRALVAGDLDTCREQLRVAYAKSPNLPPPKLMLARLVLDTGQIRFARQLLEEVAVAQPKHPEVYLLFGRLALADGHTTDAALHFQHALSLGEPKNWNDGQRAYLQHACRQGKTKVAEQRGDWDAAAKLYQAQIEARPKNAQLRDRFAMALFRAGELDRAFEQFDLAQLQDESMNPPEVSMAVMFVRQHDYANADEWFAKALAKHAQKPAVHFEHSIAMLFQDRTAEAAASANKAAELGMVSELLDMHLGLIALQSGDGAAAEKRFTEVLQQSPDNAAAATKLALLLAERSDEADRNRAVEIATQVAQAHPNSPEAVAVIGWANYRNGRKDDGETLLRAAAAQPGNDPLPLFLYARMLYAEQRTQEAEQAAKLLQQRIDQPGLFVFRPAARKWLAKVEP